MIDTLHIHSTFPDININIEKENSVSEEQSNTHTHTNMEEKESSSSTSDDSECDENKSDYTRSHMSVSRKDSNTSSLYSYSSMSTVFTGVNDGTLLANNSVYLSQISNEQYNKMEVVNDIK